MTPGGGCIYPAFDNLPTHLVLRVFDALPSAKRTKGGFELVLRVYDPLREINGLREGEHTLMYFWHNYLPMIRQFLEARMEVVHGANS